MVVRKKEGLGMSKLGDPRYESEVPGKAVWKGKELPVDGVTIPPFSTGLVNFLHAIRLFDLLLRRAPDVLRAICLLISPYWLFRVSPGHWYLFRTFGKPGVLKEVRHVSGSDAAGIVWFLRKPGCMSNTWILSAAGGARLIKMVSKKYGSNGVKEFDNKSGAEITQILKVLHSQAAGADRAWPELKHKNYEAAKAK